MPESSRGFASLLGEPDRFREVSHHGGRCGEPVEHLVPLVLLFSQSCPKVFRGLGGMALLQSKAAKPKTATPRTGWQQRLTR